MKRLHHLGALAVVLALAGCGGGGSTSPSPAAPAPSSFSAASPTADADASEQPAAASGDCAIADLAGKGAAMQKSWTAVLGSRSAGDHKATIDAFKKQVKDLFDEARALSGPDAKLACGTLELASLNLDAAVLNVSVVADSGEDSTYADVATAANDWLKATGLDSSVAAFPAKG